MTDSKVRPEHRRRAAFVYVRQSSPQQVERHRESTLRQYAFVERARELGWPPERIRVIDEDLGRSGASTDGRDGFERLAAEIALRRVGLVLGLEVSRLARNNSAGTACSTCAASPTRSSATPTASTIQPCTILLGPERDHERGGTASTGAWPRRSVPRPRAASCAARCRWATSGGTARARCCCMPTTRSWARSGVFERFAEIGSVRGVWMWFRDQELTFPRRQPDGKAIRWRPPTVNAIRQVLGNPVYAGAYVFGKTRQERYVGRDGTVASGS